MPPLPSRRVPQERDCVMCAISLNLFVSFNDFLCLVPSSVASSSSVPPSPNALQALGSDFCGICWVEDLCSAPTIMLPCGHAFHYEVKPLVFIYLCANFIICLTLYCFASVLFDGSPMSTLSK